MAEVVWPSGGRGLESHREAVHAVAQPGRPRTVIEDVAEVTAAATAMDRRPHHAQRYVPRGADGFLERGPEARPACAAIEFGRRREERKTAPRAGECAAPCFVVQW